MRKPSLYNYVGGLEISSASWPSRVSGSWGNAYPAPPWARRATTVSSRSRRLTGPSSRRGQDSTGLPCVPTRLSDPDDPELRATEGEALGPVLAVLASCGVRGEEESIHAARGLRSLAHGFATLEEAGGFGVSLDPDESFRKLVCAFAEGVRRFGEHEP